MRSCQPQNKLYPKDPRLKFNLNHTPKNSGLTISRKSSIMLIGSCFSENIGAYLSDFKFNTVLNPSGIQFNPASIHGCLQACLQDQKTKEDGILERDGLFYSYFSHSSFSSLTKNGLIESMDHATHNAHLFLKTADVLMITFGTAFLYYHRSLQQPVANCHKQPSELFEKRILEVDEIVNMYSALFDELRSFNPRLKIIFTVSPVKYLKDGIEENNLSKATLLLSIHKLTSRHAACFYFPAFELVNDDLRDYRFYKEDLAHPNQMAIDYIWEKFSSCYFDGHTTEVNRKIHKLNQALKHRQMQENSHEIQKLKDFIDAQKQEIKMLDPSIEF